MRPFRYDGRTSLRKAARKRLADAEALLRVSSGHHGRAAGYLGGYAVECKLKAIAMEAYACYTLGDLARKWDVDERDVYTHGLEVFSRRTHGLWDRLRKSHVWRDFSGVVNTWRPDWRYDPRDWPHDKARLFVTSVKRILDWLESNRC